ncbi:class I SAM-dependent methyltransferase [Streptomyces sp. NBC_00201]|uniref:class I SAM-dependent methyltransferase n=1 Tax=unclassified Streptomyces TaxID=2593676 RepID=UPI00224E956E|nr:MULTISPECIES: class I SAM-dependent methyltransferase [unclassified Streptomyces]MCX5063728.1 class I SAM-dependent methyltransferase [Streptomyces sp. NBC_00452]MCX5251883.1 class I SAM-dependent methyltransferase [Streptomyces sp. NBC_00201]MCX5294214.1 class I SAM-dependent methyltransferase [Streptomyces sp. NBC_00183]
MSAPASTPRLAAADWDQWFTTGHPQLVSDKETMHFHRLVRPRPGMRAVDLGCGSGQWTRQLAAWGVSVRGYDFSAEALRQATAAGLRGGLSYDRWDINAEAIPPELKPGCLDLITCRYALPYLDFGRLLTDVGRWLKPTGTFYALVRVLPAPPGTDGKFTDEAGPDSAVEAFRRGLTAPQLATIGSGWAHHKRHQLSPQRQVIVLRGYDDTTPDRSLGHGGVLQTPGAGGDAPSPESYAPAPGPGPGCPGGPKAGQPPAQHAPPCPAAGPASPTPLACSASPPARA